MLCAVKIIDRHLGEQKLLEMAAFLYAGRFDAYVIMGGQWMDGFFDEPSARAVNSPPPSCYKDSIEQVAPAMPRARHEPN